MVDNALPDAEARIAADRAEMIAKAHALIDSSFDCMMLLVEDGGQVHMAGSGHPEKLIALALAGVKRAVAMANLADGND